MGANGLSLNSDGDVDVTFAPLPAAVEIRGGGGVNCAHGARRLGRGRSPTRATSRCIAGDLGDS